MDATEREGPRRLSRSPLVLGGLLLVMVGLADVVVGHRKVDQYRQEVRAIPPPPLPDPAELFPKLSAADEKEEILRAKLGYYRLLDTAGRTLLLLGAGCVALGYVRFRLFLARSR